MGCRVERTREWAARLMHESRFHEFASFITLTYSDEFLPPDYGLHKREWVLFMKKLRNHWFEHYPDVKLRFYAVGEYGETNLRPHYHAIIYGAAFPDQKLFSRGSDPTKDIYTSDTLTKLWGKGFTTHAHVSYANAAYVAGYVRKKITGKQEAAEHYRRINPDTGETFHVEPEFALMSRMPGIGRQHIEKHLDDVYPDDFIIVDGHKSRVPRYYDKILDKLNPSGMETVRAQRKEAAQMPAFKANSTKSRLAVRHAVAQSKAALTKRKL